MSTVTFRCDKHEYEWLAGHAGCPRCLRAALEMAQAELVTVKARLTEPYCRNVEAVLRAIEKTLKG